MSNQTEPRKNKKLVIIAGLAVLAIVGLVAAKTVLENKIEAWATEDLSLYEPLIKLESGTVEASLFGAGVIYKDLVYSMPDLPGLKIVIDQMSETGVDWDTLMGNPGDLSSIDRMSVNGLRVFFEDYEQPLLEMGSADTADIVIPYRDMRATLFENKGNNDAIGLFKAMLPVVRNASMQSGASSARDLKMNMRQLGLFDFYLGLATASGAKMLNQETDGFDAAIDDLAYKNFKFTGEDFGGDEWQATLDSFTLKGLKYNYKAMLAAMAELDGLDEESGPEDLERLLPALLASLYNYKYDEISADKLAVNVQGAVFTLERMLMGPRTLKEQGPNVVSNIKLAVAGNDVFSLEAAGLDKLVLSGAIVDIFTRPDYYMDNLEIFEEFADDPLPFLKGLALDNLYIKNLDVTGMVRLDNWRSDFSVDEIFNFGSRISKLYVSSLALRQASMFADPNVGDLIEVLAMNPEGLTLDSGLSLDMDMRPDALGYDLELDAAAAGQGKLALQAAGETGEPVYEWDTYGPPLLGSMKMNVVDEGILNNVFNYMAKQGMANSLEEARASLLADLDAALQGAGPNEARLLRGVKTFLMNGGGLSVSTVASGQDFAPTFAELFDYMEELEVSVSNSPPAPAVMDNNRPGAGN